MLPAQAKNVHIRDFYGLPARKQNVSIRDFQQTLLRVVKLHENLVLVNANVVEVIRDVVGCSELRSPKRLPPATNDNVSVTN